ncbi:MAG: hypothetical protein ISR65_06975 [Bacteriovoracaceae bacterium]|nr:hypothetical protein [Bacteriovoracaceae bacterium]
MLNNSTIRLALLVSLTVFLYTSENNLCASDEEGRYWAQKTAPIKTYVTECFDTLKAFIQYNQVFLRILKDGKKKHNRATAEQIEYMTKFTDLCVRCKTLTPVVDCPRPKCYRQKELTRVNDKIAVISRIIDNEEVHMLETKMPDGSVRHEEFILDGKSGFYSFNGRKRGEVGVGRKLLNHIITEAGSGKKKLLEKRLAKHDDDDTELHTFVVLMDAGNLGEVNYFRQQMMAGDEYLEELAGVIANTPRLGTRITHFKPSNGDEFLTVVHNISRNEMFLLSKRMNRAAVSSESVQKVFKTQIQDLMREIRAEVRSITASENAVVSPELEVLLRTAENDQKMQGNMTIVAAKIRPGDDLQSIQARMASHFSTIKACYLYWTGLLSETKMKKYAVLNPELVCGKLKKKITKDGSILPHVFEPIM